MRIASAVVVAVMFLAAGLLTSGAAGQDASVRNGLLAFDEASTPNGFDQIWVVTPTGRGLRRLTHNEVFDSDPAWSPDGRMIAYDKGDGLHSDIYVMSAQGKQQHQLTRKRGEDAASPAWSPNGHTIAYSNGGEIYTIGIDGAHPQRLTGQPAVSPAWSPDGRKIAYAFGAPPQIFVMNADGSDQRRLTVGDVPAWSPDGKSIAFLRSRKDTSDIYVMDANGQSPHAVTKDAPVFGAKFAWAPDGRQFAFVGGDFNVHVMPASGGPIRRVDHGGHASGEVSWQPIR